MIVKFFKTGTSNAEPAIRYLLGERNHTGDERAFKPEILEGSAELTTNIINSISRQHKYCSGCLAFRENEKPTKEQLSKIIKNFKEVVAPGLEEEQFNSFFVIHRDKPNPSSGQQAFHIHFIFPMVLLGGVDRNGKELAGKRWNPHPPGKQTIQVMKLFTQITNHQHNWEQVHRNTSKFKVASPKINYSTLNRKQKTSVLQSELRHAIAQHHISNRDELLTFMEDGLGLTITRLSNTSISVKFAGDKQAIKLKGAMFEPHTNFKKLALQMPTSLTTTEHKRAVEDLSELLAIKAHHLLGGRTEHIAKTTIRKGNVYEREQRKQNNSGGPKHHLQGGTTSRCKNFLLIGKSGLVRNFFPRCEGLWGHSVSRTIESIGGRSETIKDTAPSPIPKNQINHDYAGGTGRTGGGLRPSASGPTFNIEQKIWSLSLELGDCPVGSAEAMAIIHQLNVLQKQKEESKYQTSLKSIKPKFR
jgi:hypothetical protein